MYTLVVAVIDCGPADFADSNIELLTETYNTQVYSEINYTCVEGYWFNGTLTNKTAVCTLNRTWEAEKCTGTAKLPSIEFVWTVNSRCEFTFYM